MLFDQVGLINEMKTENKCTCAFPLVIAFGFYWRQILDT